MRSIGIASALWIAFLIASMSGAVAHADFVVPPLSGPVVDQAGIIDPGVASSLDAALRRLREQGGPQINVLTVPSLDGVPIESASIKVTDTWKLGGQKKDDGVLLLVAVQERRLRIEVGQGLEGVLTDLESKHIIEDQITPYFRAGRASDGIVSGVRAIVGKTAPEALSSFGDAPRALHRGKEKNRSSLPLPVIIFFVILFLLMGRGQRRSGLLGALAGAALGSSGRGGWGDRGGGGGSGWGGGGGGFSGGGASGGW